jgi:hypothetical protein
MGEGRPGAGAVLVAAVLGAGKVAAPAQFNAQLQEGVGGRQPFELQAILAEVFAEQDAVHEAVVGEVPDMGMLLVGVADA